MWPIAMKEEKYFAAVSAVMPTVWILIAIRDLVSRIFLKTKKPEGKPRVFCYIGGRCVSFCRGKKIERA